MDIIKKNGKIYIKCPSCWCYNLAGEESCIDCEEDELSELYKFAYDIVELISSTFEIKIF